ncbi:hypothetical protein B9Z51_06940 [Limnohabitans sp. T6-5]|uniref:hypothetical protein n=1 Tax=Limnohabitans sp. T6-5 TaxID=1100724 RepID=UPI000D37B9F0|nr:hypothetical protein [Limnohabitans sp. T6-5]PUE08680.1 hypothetical protein B9Z51_06940 [Limnohabitans sp. T6-5]
MKILVTPQNGAVTGVTVCAGPQSLNVLVNTRNRWIEFHRQGGSMAAQEDPVTGLVPEHQHFLIELDSPNETGLTLVAETSQEAQSLQWHCFALQDKDQINFLFQPLQTLPQIATWRAVESQR